MFGFYTEFHFRSENFSKFITKTVHQGAQSAFVVMSEMNFQFVFETDKSTSRCNYGFMSSICSNNKNVREFIHWMLFFFSQKKNDLYACCPSSPEYGHLAIYDTF